MGKPKTVAIVPVWAQRIEVEVRRSSLWITGWGHIPSPVITRTMEVGFASKMDLLQKFRNYGLRHLNQDPPHGAGIYQFADANDDEKLIAFCREFGPVWGEVQSSKYEDNGTYTVTVTQSTEQLREEQKKFRTAVKLLQQFNKSGKADRAAMIGAIHDLQVLDPGVLGTLFFLSEVIPLAKSNTEKTRDLLPFVNIVLCGIVNEYPPKWCSIDTEAVELPDVQSEGIRSAIYHQFRLDYLAGRTIGTCLNCGHHFPVYRRGSRACGESCSRALRNQKYWNDNKEEINRAKRHKREKVGKERTHRRTNGTQKAR